MSSTLYLVIASVFLLYGFAAVALIPPKSARPPTTPPWKSRWRSFRIRPQRFFTPRSAAVEEVSGDLCLFSSEEKENWSPRISFLDRDRKERIRFKSPIFSARPALKIFLDGEPLFLLRVRKKGAGLELIPLPDGPSLELSGDPLRGEWELRERGRTITLAFLTAEKGAGSSGGQGEASAKKVWDLDILSKADPLPQLAVAAGIEVIRNL